MGLFGHGDSQLVATQPDSIFFPLTVPQNLLASRNYYVSAVTSPYWLGALTVELFAEARPFLALTAFANK